MPTRKKRPAARNSRSKRKQLKLPEGDFNTSISAEEQESKLQNYVVDYKLQVAGKLKKMKKYIQTLKGTISNCYRSTMIQLVKSVKEMTMEEFFSKGGTVDAVISAQVHATITGLVNSSTSSFGGPANCRLPLTNLSNTNDIAGLHVSLDQLSVMSQATSNVQTAGKSTRKRKQVTADKPAAHATGTRSSRRLQAKASSLTNNDVTPMPNVSTLSVLSTATFITPKFDPRVPIPAQSLREPKAGERIISMSGSPLANPIGPGSGSASLIIPLTGGKTMQLSVDDNKSSMNNEEMDVTNDSVAQENIKLLQEKLSQLLKMPKDMK